MNRELYRIADEHLVEEFERQRGVLEVVESGMTLAAEVARALAAGTPLPEMPRSLPAPQAPTVEWIDWAIVAGGLRLAQMPAVPVPQVERLFDPVAA